MQRKKGFKKEKEGLESDSLRPWATLENMYYEDEDVLSLMLRHRRCEISLGPIWSIFLFFYLFHDVIDSHVLLKQPY